jgi:hypothetical protein
MSKPHPAAGLWGDLVSEGLVKREGLGGSGSGPGW